MTDRVEKDVLVVGIDMGLTCTGVSFALLSTGEPLLQRVILDWPGPYHVTRKVRTALHYRAGHDGVLTWGETCPMPEHVEPGEAVKTWFKLKLDEQDPNREDCPIVDVKKWYKEFLVKVHEHIEISLSKELKRDLSTIRIDYIFSIPTTWRDRPVRDVFRAIIRESGFGSGAEIGLSEAEASAVYAARNGGVLFENGATLLVCDAGGGTTDVCILKITDMHDDVLEMKHLVTAKGIEVGAVQIDEAFVETVNERLGPIRKTIPSIPDHAAREMLESRFQPLKATPGGLPGNPSVKLIFEVPGLQHYNNPKAMIKNGRMRISRDLVQGWFDKQINGIIKHIDKLLQCLPQGECVSHIVLCGGFSSSEYFKDAIDRQYGNRGMKIIAPEHPELAVCKGLVMDQVQRVLHQELALTLTYGLVLAEKYNAQKHRGQRQERGPVDDVQYAVDQIHWFIFKDDGTNSITLPICRKASLDVASNRWKARIVVSNLPLEDLPTSLSVSSNDVRVAREIVVNLPASHLMEGNPGVTRRRSRMIFPRGNPFWKVKYEFVAVIDPTTLRFEVQFQGRARNVYASPVRWKTTTQIDKPPLDQPTADEWFNGPIRQKS